MDAISAYLNCFEHSLAAGGEVVTVNHGPAGLRAVDVLIAGDTPRATSLAPRDIERLAPGPVIAPTAYALTDCPPISPAALLQEPREAQLHLLALHPR